MNRPTDMTDKPDPWRVPIAVVQIPDTGLHRDLEADKAAACARFSPPARRSTSPR